MFTPRTKQVLFFDLNQTLLDPEPAFRDGFLDTLRQYAGRWSEDDGSTTEELFAAYQAEMAKRRLAVKANTAATAQDKIRAAALGQALQPLPLKVTPVWARSFFQRVKRYQEAHPHLQAGARRTLETLAERYQLAVISNGTPERQLAKIARANLGDLFPDAHVFASSRPELRKPHAGLFKAALQGMRVRPEFALMIGDSWKKDVQGALQCGIDAVWLHAGHSKKSSLRKAGSRRIVIIRKLEQLVDLL